MAGNAVSSQRSRAQSASSLIYDPRIRGIFYQVLTVVILAAFVWVIVTNTITNLQRSNISSGFGFLNGRAGFDIIAASIIGFIVGIARLSNNWLISKLAQAYVEIFRNIPPLLVIFFWYKGVLSLLPDVKQALSLPLSVFVSNRGIYMPAPVFGEVSP